MIGCTQLLLVVVCIEPSDLGNRGHIRQTAICEEFGTHCICYWPCEQLRPALV